MNNRAIFIQWSLNLTHTECFEKLNSTCFGLSWKQNEVKCVLDISCKALCTKNELDELHPKTPNEHIYSYYISSIFNIICSHLAAQIIFVLNIIKMFAPILFLIVEIMYMNQSNCISLLLFSKLIIFILFSSWFLKCYYLL